MTHDAANIPAELRISFDAAPSVETRAALGHEIKYHGRTVPQDARRFALSLYDEKNRLGAGLSGVLSRQWLFVEALWVSDDWRSRGIGRALLAQAEVHAVAAGCHSVWLDTFQASGFYLALGYQQFGRLNDVLEVAGRGDEAQAARWSCFESSLSARHLRDHLCG